MHEYSLVRSLLGKVAREAKARGALSVRRVTVRLGAASGVERVLFETAFRHCRASTAGCDAAELVVTEEAVEWRCPVCTVAVASDGTLACPDCGRPTELAAGDALVLERIELEVPKHV